ncbi:unnamed protein product [Ceratitis capitata]|uniref:(Mediterranean fruit fly) hypothetical protein n=1 Tax=Ceratitis capitata TaxID=7213 RepID=A0A811V4Q5_CERCA|nr:unnamed protein product [Ceratitis capitata]
MLLYDSGMRRVHKFYCIATSIVAAINGSTASGNLYNIVVSRELLLLWQCFVMQLRTLWQGGDMLQLLVCGILSGGHFGHFGRLLHFMTSTAVANGKSTTHLLLLLQHIYAAAVVINDIVVLF